MKKALLVSIVLLASSFAHAQLDGNCERGIKEAANGYNQVQAYLESGDLSPGTRDFFIGSWKDAAQSAALACVGLEQIKMEKSFRGRVGLISDDEIVRRSADVYTEAVKLFNTLTGQ